LLLASVTLVALLAAPLSVAVHELDAAPVNDGVAHKMLLKAEVVVLLPDPPVVLWLR